MALSLLPAGEERMRYRQEFAADLCALDRRRQVAYALGVLLNAGALRAAMRGGDTVALIGASGRRWRCRLTLTHRWHVYSAEDGRRYRRCTRCGKDDDGNQYPDNGTFSAFGGG